MFYRLRELFLCLMKNLKAHKCHLIWLRLLKVSAIFGAHAVNLRTNRFVMVLMRVRALNQFRL